MEFPRQQYWSEVPFPTLGDLPDPGIEPMFLVSPALAGGFFAISTARKHLRYEKSSRGNCAEKDDQVGKS